MCWHLALSALVELILLPCNTQNRRYILLLFIRVFSHILDSSIKIHKKHHPKKLINRLYHCTQITKEIDELDQFAMMVRMNYAYSKVNELSEEEKLHDSKLLELCEKKFQEKD